MYLQLTIREILNSISILLTAVLLTYGFLKGYDIFELSIINLNKNLEVLRRKNDY